MSSGAFKVTHIENENILDIYLRVSIITDYKFNFIFNIGDLIKDASLSNVEYKYQLIFISTDIKNAERYNDVHMDFISNIYVENGYV